MSLLGNITPPVRQAYLWSPNPRAKLFSRFVFEKDVVFDGEPVEVQFANFKNHEEFLWVQEFPKVKKGLYQSDRRILSDMSTIHIKTNHYGNIEQDDIVWLIHPLFPDGKYFLVSEPVEVEMAEYPANTANYKYLTLETINFDQPNFEWFENKN